MISTVEKVLFLKSVDLFSRIPGEDLAQIAGIAQEVNFENGELVIQEGEMGDSMFLIVDGEVMIHKTGQELNRLGEREAFGEMAILDNEPRSASVTASRDSTCLKVEREDFYELMSEKVEIAYGIIRVLTHRLRDANKKISDSQPPCEGA
jgi:CRP/FNR family transcriptional regulator, cyclic AMP receptor protein